MRRVWFPHLVFCLGALAVLLLPPPALAQESDSHFRDPQDGSFDVSGWLATAGGFLPVVTPITEPAVGYGGGLVLGFFHRPRDWTLEGARRQFENRERMPLPSITAAFGLYASSKSWGAGGGHLAVWDDGQWQYFGGAGYVNLNLSISETLLGSDFLLDYELSGWGIIQSVRRTFGSSDLSLGFGYSFMRTRARPGPNDLGLLESENTLSAPSLSLRYDTRNSPFTQDRGLFVQVTGQLQVEALGSDLDYPSGHLKLRGWFDPARPLVVGLRADASIVGDGVPFWGKPGVSLRGVASGRYTGDRAGTFEGELRWDVVQRWSLVGFGGAGWTIDVGNDDARWVGGGGGGFRYLLARAFGLRGGIDLAWGKDGFALYFVTGSSWN